MPSYLLGIHEGALFDVVGNRGGVTNAITHVGLLAAQGALSAGSNVLVLDMGLTLQIDPPATLAAHVAGTLSLTREEVKAIEEWIAELRTLVSRCRYLAYPAAVEDRDQTNQRIRGWKFSCAGFVVTAYKQAGIQLVVQEPALPPLDLSTVREVWSHIARGRDPVRMKRHLEGWGLKGDGPWNVLVPGYILHALNQTREVLPYQPAASAITFP
jgi:hypothetical protein